MSLNCSFWCRQIVLEIAAIVELCRTAATELSKCAELNWFQIESWPFKSFDAPLSRLNSGVLPHDWLTSPCLLFISESERYGAKNVYFFGLLTSLKICHAISSSIFLVYNDWPFVYNNWLGAKWPLTLLVYHDCILWFRRWPTIWPFDIPIHMQAIQLSSMIWDTVSQPSLRSSVV